MSCLAATENLTQMAIGFADGSVVIYKGDITSSRYLDYIYFLTRVQGVKYGDGNENATKQSVYLRKKTHCARAFMFLYISWPSPAKQQRQMTKFKVFWRMYTHDGEFFHFLIILERCFHKFSSRILCPQSTSLAN